MKLSKAEVKNVWSYESVSTSLYGFMEWCLIEQSDKFTSTYTASHIGR